MAKKIPPRAHRRGYKHLIFVIVLSIGGQMLLRTFVSAAAITNAKVTLSDSRPGATTADWSFSFTVNSGSVLKSFAAQVCTTASGSCITPSGFSAGTSTLAAQPTGFGDPAGWTGDSITGSLRFKKSANAAPPSGSQAVTFTGIVNPDTAGIYYARLTTYSDSAYTAPVDSSTVAIAITPGVLVSAEIDPTLSFDVTGVPAATIYKGSLATAANCTDTATSVKFGTTASPLSADTDFDCAQTLTASTNASGGYQVTINGQVPGNDLRLNANPSITIADWSGTNASPTATPNSALEVFGYTTSSATLSGIANRFTTADNLFAGLTNSADEVARSTAPAASETTNIGFRLRFTGFTAAGTYSGTITYTCTGTF